MMDKTSPEDRRAQHVALLGFFLELAAFGTLLGVGIWSKSAAIVAASRFMLAGVPIWIILYLIFKQIRRVRIEQLETAELSRAREAGATGAIFEMEPEAVYLEQNRLRWMVRWLLPTGTIIVVLILLAGHFVAWGWSLPDAFKTPAESSLTRTQDPTMMMWFVVGVGFLCFLYSRYVIALSRLPEWRLLHAGAVYMAGNAFACLGLAIALMATTIDWAEPLVAYVIRWAMIVLGIELAINFVFDFYRPRHPGVVARPSFDSRLLGLFSEPGGIAKSIADAANYQFGFEVSSTWFYQLLQRWLFPIMVVTAMVVLAMTSLVVVKAEEQAIVERFGQPIGPGTRVLEAGIHFKWPYPIEIVHRAPVKRVGEIVIGEASEEDTDDPSKAILWTEAHDYVPELLMLVAAPKSSAGEGLDTVDPSSGGGTRSVASSLLMVSVPIEFRVKDITKYLYGYISPDKVLEAVAYQYLTDYAASVDIDVLMAPGRGAINAEIKDLLQRRLDELDAGIEIVFVGVRGAHPPAKSGVAAAFQSAVAAQTNMQATIHAAEGEARRTLTSVAGMESRALALDAAVRHRDRLQSQTNIDSGELEKAKQRVDELMLGNAEKGMAPLSGQAAALIADARASASELISQASAKVRAFATEVAAYEAAPKLYKQRKMLEVYAKLDDIRKYVILGDPTNVVIEYIGVEQGGLDRVLSEGVEKEHKKHGGGH